MLHQISYQELKTLTLQYPYAANLRYLMLIKSLLDNNREHEKNLTLASLGSLDRRKLAQLVALYQVEEEFQESFSLEEDFLELKDLSTLEDIPAEADSPLAEMAAEPPTLEDAVLEMGEMQSDSPSFEDSEDLGFLDAFLDDEAGPVGESVVDGDVPEMPEGQEAPAPELELENVLMEETGAAMPQAAEEKLDMKASEEETIEEEFSIEELLAGPIETALDETQTEKPEIENMEDLPSEAPEDEKADGPALDDLEATLPPAPASWLGRVKKPQKGFVIDDLSELTPVGKKEKKGKAVKPLPKDNVKKVVSKSILEDSDIATETLAMLLERQGYHGKAIEMYERLQVKFPERSRFFGDKIEALKKMK